MKLSKKRIFTGGLILLGAGAVLTGIGYFMGGRAGVCFHGSRFLSYHSQNHSYVLEKTEVEAFENLDIAMGYEGNISLLPSKDSSFYVEYTLSGAGKKPVLQVEDNTLRFEQGSSGIVLSFGFLPASDTQEGLKVYVPETAKLKNVSIEGDYGDVSLDSLTAQNLALTLEGCNLALKDITGNSLTLDCGNTDVKLSSVALSENLDAVLDYGDFRAKDLSFASGILSSDDGDVKLDTLSGTSFDLNMGYGEASLLDFHLKDSLSVQSETGDISADLVNCKKLSVEAEYGDVTLENINVSENSSFDLESGDLVLSAAKLGAADCVSSYGDVLFQLSDSLDKYNFHLETESGEISFPEDEVSSGVLKQQEDSGSFTFLSSHTSPSNISISCETGNIQVKN